MASTQNSAQRLKEVELRDAPGWHSVTVESVRNVLLLASLFRVVETMIENLACATLRARRTHGASLVEPSIDYPHIALTLFLDGFPLFPTHPTLPSHCRNVPLVAPISSE